MANANTEFQFVNSTLSCPTVPQDLAVRSMIRKQQTSAARKRNGNYGKHNLRQYPIFLYEKGVVKVEPTGHVRILESDLREHDVQVISQEGVKNPSTIKAKRVPSDERQEDTAIIQDRCIGKVVLSELIPRSPSAKGFELTCSKANFNVLLLSSLAILHTCRPVRQLLSQDPSRLVVQLQAHRRCSYFTYIPSRYDDVACLRDAIDCVMARTKQIVSPDKASERGVIRIYVTALRSLQAALNDPEQRLKPEVLCATEILALYELLDPSGEAAWVRHAAGAARLIQLRGPRSFKTDFEKALFVAQCISIATEGVLNSERCFLEQNCWSETVISLTMLKNFLPGAFVDVTTVVCNNRHPDPEYLDSLIIRIRRLRDDFLEWNMRYQAILPQCSLEPGSLDHDSHCKVFSHYLSSIMIVQRMLACISPTERKQIAGETEVLVAQMLELELEAAASPTNVFIALTVVVSHTVNVTADDWSGSENADDSTGLIERKKLVRWCNILGRNMLEKEHPREGREMFLPS